jgi:hypothetical protein
MKTIIRRSFLLFLLLNVFAFAKSEIINQNVIKQSSLDKITEISNELYVKTGVSIVGHFVEKTDNGIVEYENNVSSGLTSPYVLIVFSAKDQKVDIVVSSDLQKVVNKNEILNTFMIPILAAQDKNSVDTKYSAALLNGIAEIADEVASSKNIKLDSSIGSDSRYFMQGLRALFYGIIFVALGIYFYRLYQRRRAA